MARRHCSEKRGSSVTQSNFNGTGCELSLFEPLEGRQMLSATLTGSMADSLASLSSQAVTVAAQAGLQPTAAGLAAVESTGTTAGAAPSTWRAPIGVPEPAFGIREDSSMYQGKLYDYGSGPQPYKTDSYGVYTHYVDNTASNATDYNNPFGTPDKPRMTIPTALTAGSVVQVHSGTYGSGGETRISGKGDASHPIFIRGVGPTQPRLSNQLLVGYYNDASYIIAEGMSFHNIAVLGRSDHIAIRNSEIRGDANSGGLMITSWNNDSVHDVVSYNNYIHDNGSVSASYDQDVHGMSVGTRASNVWILDNEFARNSGDGIQINGGTALQSTLHNIYIGRNVSHDNKQTGMWTKQAVDVVFSQNTVYGHRPSNSSYGAGMGYQYAPENVWFLYNHSYNNEVGIGVSSDDGGFGRNAYFIGNVIHNIHPTTSSTSGSAWSSAGIMLGGGFNDYIENNTIYDVNAGINVAGWGAYYIRNNIISGVTNPQGNDVYIESGQAIAKSTVTNNIFYNNGAPARIKWGDSFVYDVNGIQKLTSQASGNITADPQYVNAGAGNFQLASSSPAINAGITPTSPATFQSKYGLNISVDNSGASRPVGAWDIGAFESGSTVTPPPPVTNRAPTANNDSAATVKNTAVKTASVLANDTDPDGDTLSINAFGKAAHGTVVKNGDGAFTYTPTTGYVGADSFMYTVSDGRGGTAIATVGLTVAATTPVPGTGPKVTSVSINDGTIYRSWIRSISMTFSSNVSASLSAGLLKLRNVSQAVDTNLSAMPFTYDAATNTARWDTTNAEIHNGNFTATLSGTAVRDASGALLTGNGTTARTDYSFNFHRLRGDFSGDHHVGVEDLGIFGVQYGKQGTNLAGDMDGNGVVDVADLGIFSTRYGDWIPL